MKKLLNTLYVTTEDSFLGLDGENIVIYVHREEKGRLPLHTLQNILLFGYEALSPALMHKCLDMGISISFFSMNGKYLASVSGNPNGNVLLRRQQYRFADDENKSFLYAKTFILAKIHNCRMVLERSLRDHPECDAKGEIKRVSKTLKEKCLAVSCARNLEYLRGIEGDAARDYFSVFDDLILNKEKFKFDGRNRRPPRDCVNALLSFVYAMLVNEISGALTSVGLDPYVGFMHTDRPGRKSLACDVEEELRASFADRFVLTCINLRILREDMFTKQIDGAVFLNEDGRKKVITEWQNRKKEYITHPFLGERIMWGTVPIIQAQLLANSIRLGGEYPPFLWK